MVRVVRRLTRFLRNRGLSGGGPLALTLNNMTQGVVLFELSGRLVVCNDQYLRMYGLSPDFVGPGSNLKDIVAERVKTGSLQRDPAEYCAELMEAMAAGKIVRFVSQTSDGRAVSVVNRAIPSSNYWVGTHDDITEWRAAERQSALLDDQETRRGTIEQAIVWFRESVEGALQTVAESVTAMQSTAEILSANSIQTNTHTTGAVKISNDAFASVEVAATAADELSKSIAEIDRQLARASDVVRGVATEAQSTNEEIAALARATQKIDDVVKLIQSVAGQTNLLALNATIEAARAGAAGRGFAVVASEVKALAVQTQNATEEISKKIEALQKDAAGSVDAVHRISQAIEAIRPVFENVNGAVAEQNETTSEMSNNAATTSHFIVSVGDSAAEIDSATREAEAHGESVAKAGNAVTMFAQKLKSRCAVLLRQNEREDQRKHERLPCHLKIEVQTARGPIAAEVYEISMEGILIVGPDAERLPLNQSLEAQLESIGACRIRTGERSKAGTQARFEAPDAELHAKMAERLWG